MPRSGSTSPTRSTSVDPAWRRLPVEERVAGKEAFAEVVEEWARRIEHLRAYSITGVRPDCDFFLWKITERYHDLGELGAELNGTPLAGWLETPYSYLATTKASQYTSARKPRKIVPHGSPYLVVYPFVKVRPWYALPHEDRQRAMDEHIRIGARVRVDPQPHDVLVRDRRPGVHDRVRVRRAGRLHAPDADAARVGGEPLHRARHADLRRHARRLRARSMRSTAPAARVSAGSGRLYEYVCWSRQTRHMAKPQMRARGRTRARPGPTAGATRRRRCRPGSARRRRRTRRARGGPELDLVPALAPGRVQEDPDRDDEDDLQQHRDLHERRVGASATIPAETAAMMMKPRSVGFMSETKRLIREA